jgi:hypothetical protein
MAVANARLWTRFDEGGAVEALLGEGSEFIPSHTYRTHDDLLVIRQLREWAAQRGQPGAVQQAIRTAVEQSADERQRVGLLWAALLVERDGTPFLDRAWAVTVAESEATTDTDVQEVRAQVLAELRG